MVCSEVAAAAVLLRFLGKTLYTPPHCSVNLNVTTASVVKRRDV
jgi:hypothetical protein